MNNQVDIKSKEYNTVSTGSLYYRVKGRGAHRPCLYIFGYPEGR